MADEDVVPQAPSEMKMGRSSVLDTPIKEELLTDKDGVFADAVKTLQEAGITVTGSTPPGATVDELMRDGLQLPNAKPQQPASVGPEMMAPEPGNLEQNLARLETDIARLENPPSQASATIEAASKRLGEQRVAAAEEEYAAREALKQHGINPEELRSTMGMELREMNNPEAKQMRKAVDNRKAGIE